MRVSAALLARLDRAFLRAVRVSRAQVVQTVEARGHALVAAGPEPPAWVPHPDQIFDAELWEQSVLADIAPVIGELVVDAASRTAVGRSFDITDPLMATAVQGHVQAIAAWGQQFRAGISASIEEGMREGWSIERMVEDLDAKGIVSDVRARLIARTEAISASNAGTIGGWRTAGTVATKQWASSGDARVRETHQEADGQEVALDDTFIVGGFSADYPGDPALPPEERANCRCALYSGSSEVDVEALGAEFSHGRRGEIWWRSPPPPVAADLRSRPVTALDTTTNANLSVVSASWSNNYPFQAQLEGEPDTESLGMVALLPAPEIAAELVQPGGCAPEELHVTIAFLGNTALWTDQARATVRDGIAAAAAELEPVQVSIAGCGTLGDGGAVVLLLNGCFDEIRGACGELLAGLPSGDEHPNFIPHMTLGYAEDPSALIAAGAALQGGVLMLDQIRVDIGDEQNDYPLGPQPEPAPEPAPSPEVPVSPETTDTFATADELDVGVAVTWNDAEGNARTGTVSDVGGLAGDPQTVTVVPDDDPENPVELPIDALEVVQSGPMGPGGPEAPTEGARRRMRPERASLDFEAEGDLPFQPNGQTMAWRALLVVEGVPSGDMRVIREGALGWRSLPLPLMAMFKNPDAGVGHADAVAVGRIDAIWRDENNPAEVWASGVYSEDEDGQRAFEMARSKTIRGISVDLCDVRAELEAPDDPADPMAEGLFSVLAANIMGATQCGFPAFAEAHIEVPEAEAASALAASARYPMPPALRVWTLFDAEGALVASAGIAYPEVPPGEWFAEPPSNVDTTPVRVDADGRVHGFAAEAGSCHIGYADRCVEVPRSACAYAEFRKGQTLTTSGLVATGPIVFDTVHPDLAMQASDAQAFYAHTGCVVADVAVYDTPRGMYVAGAVRPGASPAGVRALRGGDISPDWRYVNRRRSLECVALLVVNNSGFKVSDALAASAGGDAIVPGDAPRSLVDVGSGQILALVAAGSPSRDPLARQVARLAADIAELRDIIAPIRAERARARLGAVVAEAEPAAP